MPSKIRLQRIADRIRDEFSEMLIMDLSDPRLGGITVTEVKVDREMAFADIYISALEGMERAEEILAALEHAKGFIRRALADRIELRIFPSLRFHWDPTPERADKIEKILHELNKQQDPDS